MRQTTSYPIGKSGLREPCDYDETFLMIIKSCLGFLIGAILSGAAFVLIMLTSLQPSHAASGQQDSISIALGATLILGTPCVALVGGIVGSIGGMALGKRDIRQKRAAESRAALDELDKAIEESEK